MEMTPVPDQKQQPVYSRRLVVSQLTEAAVQGQESKLELKSSCSKKNWTTENSHTQWTMAIPPPGTLPPESNRKGQPAWDRSS